MERYPYVPDCAIPPGETLRETMEFLGVTQAELADRTGLPRKTIYEIIKGKAEITPEVALQFDKTLLVSAGLLLSMESNYRKALAEGKRVPRATLRERLMAWGEEMAAQCGDMLGALLQRTGHPGHIADVSIDDRATGIRFAVHSNPTFTVLSIGPRSYYFNRVTGRAGGSGPALYETKIVTQGHTDISVPDSDGHAS
jgi:addiction module HigA family antidote